MNELLDKIELLEKELDKSTLVKDLKDIQDRVYKDKELYNSLKEYSYNPKEELKKSILSNSLFQEYKEKETLLNLYIMEMNQKLSKISKKGSCVHENH